MAQALVHQCRVLRKLSTVLLQQRKKQVSGPVSHLSSLPGGEKDPQIDHHVTTWKGCTQLHQAMSRGISLKEFRGSYFEELLKYVGPNKPNDGGLTPWVLFIRNRDYYYDTTISYKARPEYSKVVARLLAANADPHACDPEGTPVLHMAVRYGDEEVIRKILDYGASPDRRDAEGRTAFDLAPTPAVAKLLAQYTRDVSCLNDGNTLNPCVRNLLEGSVAMAQFWASVVPGMEIPATQTNLLYQIIKSHSAREAATRERVTFITAIP